MMDTFKELIEIADTLNNPDGGCPWDLKQTFQSLRPYILEEAHEALEAIDNEEDDRIVEELGDLFYTVIFYAKVAEREKRFSIKNIIEHLKAKLIRRHPHVFGEKKAASVEDVIRNWDKIKKDRKSALDGIPQTLPSLQRAYKILCRMKKKGYSTPSRESEDHADTLAQQIYAIVQRAAEEGVDIESAFRTLLSKEEKSFTSWEMNT
ncbi:MAG: Nucleoside triphosphate pyrophosphohydrolase [Chlamydiae bacterium]|nr:Nucleoside triphosphate pyrophosphohydrolase [Chlamydiota bacterium]